MPLRSNERCEEVAWFTDLNRNIRCTKPAGHEDDHAWALTWAQQPVWRMTSSANRQP